VLLIRLLITLTDVLGATFGLMQIHIAGIFALCRDSSTSKIERGCFMVVKINFPDVVYSVVS
jgi:hypothetical protein